MPAPLDAAAFRQGDAATLALALDQVRAHTLRLFAAWRAALAPDMAIRYAEELNPPRWELGHVGWFEDWWIGRFPGRLQGAAANPDAARAAPALRGADAMYNSSTVAHTRRWHLDLPDAEHTLRDLAATRARTLALLAQAGEDDDTLYVFRLALHHEAMHAEAAVTMAQTLALDIRGALATAAPMAVPAADALSLPGGPWQLGHSGPGFAFDNELGAHAVELAPFAIDARPVTWGQFLPFIAAGGYDQEDLWTAEGWAWRQRHSAGRPRHLTLGEDGWQRAAFGHWVALDPDQPAMHLTQHEAQAWCRWAGRRLPSEAEWEAAAVSAGEAFQWGQVWEWTASPFVPYPGFTPHPYRDYSMPWFDGRPVLRGASFATLPGLRHARYRNYFPAARNDLFAGFRTCAA